MGQPLNIWDKIQQGVRETERLISQKDYNKAMIQARQTLEAMVRFLGNRACIVESDLAATIDQLYDSRWIDKSTRDTTTRSALSAIRPLMRITTALRMQPWL